MTLGEKQNGNVATLTKDKHLPTAAQHTSAATMQQQQAELQYRTNEQIEKGLNDKKHNISKNVKQADATISFLRAARSGDLEKVLEFIEEMQITDINTCNANGLNALHLAAKDGYIDIVSELLRRGAKVDNATKKGNTALHIASLAGQKDVIKLLIQYNANVNVQSLNGFTPLYMAAQENHDACVRYLLAKGANPSLATEDGFTPLAVAMQQGHDKVVAVLLESDSRGKVRLPALHIAAKKDDVKAATLLLENEHNPDIVSKSGFTPLHIAAHYGNVHIANLLIERGADVNYIAKHNITPLHVACKWGKTNILKLLLSKNARINATTRDGLTPLHCAARSGHKDVIEILLANNAPILSKTKNGLAPLHMAAQGEHDEAARILLAHKAPVDEVTVDYLTALHVSAHCGHVRVAKLLLDYNADPNARALNGFTPLHIACKKNRIKVVELLLKHGASISATTESGLTPLHVASFMGCMNIVIYLLQHDANPDAPTVRGETPLHLAARANQTDIIRILLRNGAQVNTKAREGQTPMHVASRLGNIDIIMLLLQHGANVDATTKDIYTPLHIAAKEGQEEVAQLLIENHAQLNATTKKGFSPLHLAAKYGKVQVAQLLLQKDANVDCQGKNGVTPLHVAAHYDHQNVALLLLEKGATPDMSAKNGHTALHIAAKKNQMEIAQHLLQYSVDPNAKSKSGFAPLHLAAQEGHIDMVNLLLEHGADANLVAKNGLTPLHLSAQEDKTDVAQVLLENRANISERTKAGYTPLHVAAHYGHINMVKFLLENDANIEMSTNIGYTPLHQAAQQGHTLVINLLLTHKADPNALTNNGQTALNIADKLGYVTAVETLKVVTEKSITNTVTGVLEEKYKVVAPESIHEAFMSDSEDEGGEDHLDQQQQYKYMATDDLKTMINEHDQQNYDTTDNDEQQHAGHNAAVNETISHAYVNHNVSASNPYTIKQTDNVAITRPPIHLGKQEKYYKKNMISSRRYIKDDIDSYSLLTELERCLESFGGRMKTNPMNRESFLVSFLVDARGGAMRGCRHSGVRVIVPPKSCAQPTRITCRYVKPQRVPNPPPLMEGEALVSRIMELSPVEAKFLGPVILEVPHFGSLRDKEREIIILRSDNGESWREHTLNDSDEAVRDVLSETFDAGELNPLEDLHTNRIIRIVTRNFPHFFAVVSRIRQEVHAIGPDGGTVSSQAVPHVQAIFPPHALTKKIRVGLQAQPVDLNGCCKLLGQGVAVSPVVTVEPRRRKFHKAITLSIPAPKAYTQGMVNSQYAGNAPTLRLLCSITGGQNRAIWEDVTGSTPLAFVKDSVSFTTTVSARFWLMDCRNIADASRMATELYSYMAQVPFMVKFVVFAKRISSNEAKLSVFCMTDDKEDKTLEQQEFFTEVAKSRDVEVLEDQDIYLELAGNLVPVLKSGEQLSMKFQAFRENRLSFVVYVKDQEEPFGRVSFMSEPKAGKGEAPQQPICALNVTLEGREIIEDTVRHNGSQRSLSNVPIDHGVNYRDLINAGYKSKESAAVHTFTTPTNAGEKIHKADIRLSDICNLLEGDWVHLAKELNVPKSDIQLITTEYVDRPSQQAMVMLRLWLRQQGPQATGNMLEQALHEIGRSDIVDKCIFNLELVTDDMERAMAKLQLDQSGSEGLLDDLNDTTKTMNGSIPTTATISDKVAPTAIHDSSVLNDTQPRQTSEKQPQQFDEATDKQPESLKKKLDEATKSIEEDLRENGHEVRNLNTSSQVTNIILGLDQNSTNGDAIPAKCATPPPTPIETKNINISQDDLAAVIRPIAEEHTKRVLEDAQQKIENDEFLSIGRKVGFIAEEKPVIVKRYCAEEIIPNPDDEINDLAVQIFQDLEKTVGVKFDEATASKSTSLSATSAEVPTPAPRSMQQASATEQLDEMSPSPSSNQDVLNTSSSVTELELLLDADMINASTPLDKLTKTIKKGSRIAKKSHIPRPSVDAINWVGAAPKETQQQTAADNIKEISSLILDDVIDSDNQSSLTHDADVISPTGSSYGLDYDRDLIVRTIELEQTGNNDNMEMNQPMLHEFAIEPLQRQVSKNTRTTRHADGSETHVIVTEERKINENDGSMVVLRETITTHRLPDGTLLSSDVQSTIIPLDNRADAGKNATNITSGESIDSPFFQVSSAASMKSKTSSTKSLENQITNKTFDSSSDSDIALHEPGIELSEDDDADAVDTDFYQATSSMRPTDSITAETVTNYDDDGAKIVTTTTRIVTKGGHKLPDLDDDGLQQKQIHAEDKLMKQLMDQALNSSAEYHDYVQPTSTTTTTQVVTSTRKENGNDPHSGDSEVKTTTTTTTTVQKDGTLTKTSSTTASAPGYAADEASDKTEVHFIQTSGGEGPKKSVVEQLINHEKQYQ